MSSKIGSDKLDISVESLWNTWNQYRLGKKKSPELLEFEYYLGKNLLALANDLSSGIYQHGHYRIFKVEENKTRLISIASIRDRVVHRLVYEYLVKKYDRNFDFAIWSCRKEKGLIKAIQYCQKLSSKYPDKYFWRSDIKKFFESVDHQKLLKIIQTRVFCPKVLWLIGEVVGSFQPGISIGNLTSQIFANIYLNEFDRFVRHQLKPLGYLRYGDDFVLFDSSKEILEQKKNLAECFLKEELKLTINSKNNYLGKVKDKIKMLGCIIGSDGIILNKRNRKRIFARLNHKNISSYYGILKQFGDKKLKEKFQWEILEKHI